MILGTFSLTTCCIDGRTLGCRRRKGRKSKRIPWFFLVVNWSVHIPIRGSSLEVLNEYTNLSKSMWLAHKSYFLPPQSWFLRSIGRKFAEFWFEPICPLRSLMRLSPLFFRCFCIMLTVLLALSRKHLGFPFISGLWFLLNIEMSKTLCIF